MNQERPAIAIATTADEIARCFEALLELRTNIASAQELAERVARQREQGYLFTTRENFQAVGGFDEQFFAGEEVYFTMALKRPGVSACSPIRWYVGKEVTNAFRLGAVIPLF